MCGCDALPPCHDPQARVDADHRPGTRNSRNRLGTGRDAVPSNRHDLATSRPRSPRLALSLTSLAACGGDDGDVATDPTPTTPTATAEPTAPTAEPEPGSLPDFPYADYAYTLQMQCFCANIDQEYRITVAGGAVERGDLGDGRRRATRPETPVADEYAKVTIQDIIDKGNDPKAAHVDVEWPAGQLYPDSVYVDQDKLVADEEVTWVISEVETA